MTSKRTRSNSQTRIKTSPSQPVISEIKGKTAEYLWGRIKRAERGFVDAIIRLSGTKNPDARILIALLDRIDPKPKFSNQTLTSPVHLDVSSPQAIEDTRQRILTKIGDQNLPIEMGKELMDIVNQAADRAVMSEIAVLMEKTNELRSKLEDHTSSSVSPTSSDPGDEIGTSSLSGEKVVRPKWARPNRDASTAEAVDPEPNTED